LRVSDCFRESLAAVLGITVKNAIRILDTLVTAEVVIEVTHRSKRRLFALAGLVPIRDAVRPPYRPIWGEVAAGHALMTLKSNQKPRLLRSQP
jgi:hypothetical protein